MWHSDICHLLFAPANAFYEFTKRLERSTSLLCAFFSHITSKGAHFGLFLSVVFFFFFLIVEGECLSLRSQSCGEKRCGVLQSVAQRQTASDLADKGRRRTLDSCELGNKSDGRIRFLHLCNRILSIPVGKYFFSSLIHGGQRAVLWLAQHFRVKSHPFVC